MDSTARGAPGPAPHRKGGTQVILTQYYLRCLAHASYLIGDEESGAAAVVDPQRDIGQYLEDAGRHGLAIRHVILTHFHADFLAGHLELRERTGARIHLGRVAKAEYAFAPMGDGDRLDLGRVRLACLETPGHSPESISVLVYDRARSDAEPHAVLTGDTLFIGEVGRPDLRAAPGRSAADLAGLLYDSLREKLLPLPDATLVYPTHGAGSLCGRNISTELSSTIGEQRRYNYALQPMTRDEFIRIITADQPDAPAYFAYDVALNAREHPTLDAALERSLVPLSLEEVLAKRNAGAQVLDVREPVKFEGGHLTDSVNIGLDGQFASWAGTVLDRERPIVIVAEPGRESEAATRLGRIGFDHVAGYLRDGMAALDGHPDLTRRIDRITAPALAERLASANGPLVLDVRTPVEHHAAHIDGSLHLPLLRLTEHLAEVPRDREIVVHCATGYRSAVAASLLACHGFARVTDLVGGISAWQASRLPVASPPPA